VCRDRRGAADLEEGQSIRFPADDEELRPMGPGDVGGDRDEVPQRRRVAVDVVIEAGSAEDQRYVFTVTDGGFGKRTAVSEYRQQGRGGLGSRP
jgi:DNA gyrase subunit A